MCMTTLLLTLFLHLLPGHFSLHFLLHLRHLQVQYFTQHPLLYLKQYPQRTIQRRTEEIVECEKILLLKKIIP